MKRLWLATLCLVGAGQIAGAPAEGSAGELCRLGKDAVQRGEYAAAVELLERSVALAPRESDYAHWLGNSYAWAAATAPLSDKPGLGRKCLAAYQRAIELDPENLPARFSLMNFYRRVPRLLGGGLARAREEAAEIERRDSLRGAHARAILLGDEKKYAGAYALLSDVTRRNPSYYGAQLSLGQLALESGGYKEEGIAALRRCLELTPSENDENHERVIQYLEQLNGPRAETTVAHR